MPLYTMKNPFGEEQEVNCSIAEMERLKENGWSVVFTPNPNQIISGTDWSGQGGGRHTSNEWKDTLRRIKANNPGSNIDI